MTNFSPFGYTVITYGGVEDSKLIVLFHESVGRRVANRWREVVESQADDASFFSFQISQNRYSQDLAGLWILFELENRFDWLFLVVVVHDILFTLWTGETFHPSNVRVGF